MRLGLRARGGALLVAAAAVALVGAAVAVYLRGSTASPPTDTALHGWAVTVNGHELYIECQGEGSPAVVLDSGLGDASTVWDDVLIATEGVGVRVCAYDRWGLGRSQANPAGTRPIGDATADLHSLLAAADVPAPYVLVSHSIAGLIHRDFTQRYPSEVVGLVMVDTAPDDWNTYMKTNEFTYGTESLDVTAVTASLRASDDLGRRPVIVLLGATSNQIDGGPGFRDYWRAAQQALAGLSTNSMTVVAMDSDHGIPTTQPGLVATAIGLVVTAVHTDQPLPACAGSPLAQTAARCDAPAEPAAATTSS
jgi:pimeloyl-ACP methyl ester carboxylesterase